MRSSLGAQYAKRVRHLARMIPTKRAAATGSSDHTATHTLASARRRSSSNVLPSANCAQLRERRGGGMMAARDLPGCCGTKPRAARARSRQRNNPHAASGSDCVPRHKHGFCECKGVSTVRWKGKEARRIVRWVGRQAVDEHHGRGRRRSRRRCRPLKC